MGDFSSALQKLEFDKIVKKISHLALTEPGKGATSRLSPLTDPSAIQTELDRVSQMKELLIAEGHLPLDGVKEITPLLRKSTIENQVLTPLELIEVASTLRASRSVSGFLSKRKSQIPSLIEFIEHLHADKIVEYNIDQAIDESGRVRDGASKELRTVRQDMTSLGEQLRKRLSAILRQVAEDEFLQDEIITTRDGRFVIPVKTEYKHRVPGFIHSSSASGATVFIEPAESLDLNNALRELQFREQREIERILRTLTAEVASIRGPMEETVRILGILDFIAAKARYSIEILANAPRLRSKAGFSLFEARHPLLLQTHARSQVVPLDMSLGNDDRILIITGPNAGGKSVALKTVGLSVICAQAGLHIPASPDSELFPFDSIFVDIGDDQSVENDLSTFSSHLLNMRTVLEGADDRSLVLMDELGTGTDPAEGAALASAVIGELLKRKSIAIATTHHGDLKVFAHQTDGVRNASMEFNQETLQPTYRFRSGIPGSSYALELAERMGVPHGILQEARAALGSEKWKLESLIARLEKDIQEYQEQLGRVALDRDKLSKLVASYEERISQVQTEVRDLRKKASSEARQLVENAQSTIERIVKEIRETAADKTTLHAARRTLQEMRQQIQEAEPDSAQEEDHFAIGDTVCLKEGTEVGEIVELRGTYAVVLWKSGRIRVQTKDLSYRAKKGTGTSLGSTEMFLPTSTHDLDVRGLTGDEATAQIQYFLDNAFVAGLHRVDIIHGKGTGALRKRVGEFLRDIPHVKSFRLGEWNEGGDGVTVVELSD